MRQFLAISAIAITLAAIGAADLAFAQTNPPATPTPDASQTNVAPSQLYFPPPNGAPSGRISGGTRGIHPLTTTADSTTNSNPSPAASSTTAKPVTAGTAGQTGR
jgi:hypothetical protein